MRRLIADIALLRHSPVTGAATFDVADVSPRVLARGAWGKFGGMTGDAMGANSEVRGVLVFVVPLGLGEG